MPTGDADKSGEQGPIVVTYQTLTDLTVSAWTTIPAEISRAADHYLLIKGISNGKPVRLMLAVAGEVASPCPLPNTMLADMLDPSGIKFFTLEELNLRQTEGKALVDPTGTLVEPYTYQDRVKRTVWAEDEEEEEPDGSGNGGSAAR